MRSTRASGSTLAATVTVPLPKRKRRSSPSSPTAESPMLADNTLRQTAEVVAPSPDAKRAKISIKLKQPNAEKLAAVKVEDVHSRALNEEVRDALSVVMSQMAQSLPEPMNRILNLGLPPTFDDTEENTLGHLLKQPTLTWEALVETLHTFCSHLLSICNYPNPVPALSQFHVTVNPLPSHLPTHAIYSFCEAFYALLCRIEPQDTGNTSSAERWALMQKIPGNPATEWFTSGGDSREIKILLEKLQQSDGSLLEELAKSGNKLGYATPVTLSSIAGTSAPRKLTDAIIRRASLKAQRWKDLRMRKHGDFNSIARLVEAKHGGDTSFTSSFAPTFDSRYASVGYYDTLDARHERARRRSWFNKAFRTPPVIKDTYYGVGGGSMPGEVDLTLAQNVDLIDELRIWQELRIRHGDARVAPRENLAADELLSSLVKMSQGTKPSDLVGNLPAGYAHVLAKRLLPVSSPAIRGTLDPRRPNALHDNVTLKMRPQPLSTPGPSQYRPYGSPHDAGSAHRNLPSQTPYRPTANGMHAYSANSYARPASAAPIAGPSALRQSFGPGNGVFRNGV